MSRTQPKNIALHRHVALFHVIGGLYVFHSDDLVSFFRPKLRTYL